MPETKTPTETRDAVESQTEATARFTPDLTGLDACIEDVRRATLDSDPGPEAPDDYALLLDQVEASRDAFPPLYQQEFVDPYRTALQGLGRSRYAQLLAQDPTRQGPAGLLFDMAQTLLQRAAKYRLPSLNAFQEVIDDLYDGFLSAEDRAGVKPPDYGITPPLVKFGNPDAGPYTWPGDATAAFGAHAALVSLPPANATSGLLAWAALGHETGGHDILHADDGLQAEIAQRVRASVSELNAWMADYWASRIDETAADVLGILNMGPAAGIGLIAYFRGLNKAFTGRAVLRATGPADDPHPCDVLRGYLAAETVARLSFSNAKAWSDAIAAETDKDAGLVISLAGKGFDPALCRKSAALVAETIARTPLQALEDHAFLDIQDWRDIDERKLAIARRSLTRAVDLQESLDGSRIYAAHVVAAAVVEGLGSGGGDIKLLTDRMITLLSGLHAKNPVWGPLLVRHAGDIRRDFAYVRRPVIETEVFEETVIERG